MKQFRVQVLFDPVDYSKFWGYLSSVPFNLRDGESVYVDANLVDALRARSRRVDVCEIRFYNVSTTSRRRGSGVLEAYRMVNGEWKPIVHTTSLFEPKFQHVRLPPHGEYGTHVFFCFDTPEHVEPDVNRYKFTWRSDGWLRKATMFVKTLEAYVVA